MGSSKPSQNFLVEWDYTEHIFDGLCSFCWDEGFYLQISEFNLCGVDSRPLGRVEEYASCKECSFFLICIVCEFLECVHDEIKIRDGTDRFENISQKLIYDSGLKTSQCNRCHENKCCECVSLKFDGTKSKMWSEKLENRTYCLCYDCLRRAKSVWESLIYIIQDFEQFFIEEKVKKQMEAFTKSGYGSLLPIELIKKDLEPIVVHANNIS